MNLFQLDPRYLRNLEQRYYEKIAICEHGKECEDCCWPWLASTIRGYGQICVGDTNERAHRVGFALYFRCDVPDDQLIRHYCDYRACQQPYHWLVGTQKDNCADKIRAGTSALGGRTQLFSDQRADEIRALYNTGGWSQLSLAGKFCVAQKTISKDPRRKRRGFRRKVSVMLGESVPQTP